MSSSDTTQRSTSHTGNTHRQTDRLFADPLGEIAPFAFDASVVDVFPDMIKRSVPGYTTIISMIGDLSERYAQSDSHCYDLGCSLGAATLAMRHRIKAANCDIIAIDNSEAMLQRCQQVMDADSGEVPVTLVCDDIVNAPLENASLVVLNFTLQFLPVTQRETLLENISRALRPGGALILSEKVAFAQSHHHDLMIELHHNFKRTNGYSELEIAQKRSALDNVLVPETLDQHRQRLTRAGFASSDVWFQCFNFASLIAIK